MTFSMGLGAGLKALTAARLGLQVSGNNVANVNTPGYSRQRVLIGSDMPLFIAGGHQIGSGVRVLDIDRMFDEGIERRIRLQLALFGEAEAGQRRFRELEGIFNEPSGGLSTDLTDLFGTISALSTDPADKSRRSGVIQGGRVLADSFNLLADRIGNLTTSTFNEVRGLTREVNRHAQAIAQLNSQIISFEANGSTANDLRDSREQHIKEISLLADTRSLQRNSGAVDVIVGGSLLVSGDQVSQMAASRNSDGRTDVTIGSHRTPVNIKSGRIGGLLSQEGTRLPGFMERIDRLARNTILEFNRIHSTGVPGSGPFSTLRSAIAVVDGDGDGMLGDEFLSQSGLPFEISSGDLYVNVIDEASGQMTRTRIAIDPTAMSLRDLASTISAIDNITATVDPTGHLKVNASPGYGFDFSTRLDTDPNRFGSFGGSNPSVGSSNSGPYDLSANTFPITFDVVTGTATSPVTTSVTLNATDFGNTAVASVDELVAAINDDLGPAATAANVGGRLVIRSDTGGNSSQIQVTNGSGSVLSDLGLPTTVFNGQDNSVTVSIDGTYSGTENGGLVFVPNMDGKIGATDGLQIAVMDQNGALVATLDVGRGYSPDHVLDLGNGIKVSFGPGQVSASSGDVFALDTLADSDTSDVLVALGMNSFFNGYDAATIAINPELAGNPDLLAAANSKAAGDGSNLERLLALRDVGSVGLDQNTIENFYADIVGDLGFEAAAADTELLGQDVLLAHLQEEREAISGVNLDEEMVNMVRFQQSYEAAARFIGVVQEMTSTLINLGR